MCSTRVMDCCLGDEGLTRRQLALAKCLFAMVDYFALILSHSLLFFAGWQLLMRDELDQDPAPGEADPPPAEAPQPPKPGLRLHA